MQIPVQQFPILTPGQMNPYHQALQGGLEMYGKMNEAKYAPQKAQADIASKAAYATYSPYSYLSKAMNDPGFLAILSKNPKALSAITKKMSEIPTDPYASIRENKSNSPNLWTNLKRMVGIDNSPQQQIPQQNVPQGTMPPQVQGQGSNNSGYEYDAQGNNVRATDAEIDQAGMGQPGSAPQAQGTTSPSPQPQANNNLYDAYLAQKFPYSTEGLAAKKRLEAQNADVHSNADLWKDRTKELGKAINFNRQSLQLLDSMENQYKKLYWLEKGAGVGNLKAVSSAAQTFDQDAEKQSTALARAQQMGHVTDKDFTIFSRIKPYRGMNETAFHHSIEANRALALRDVQYQRFMSEAKQKNMPIEQADTMWSKFIEENPIFDPTTEKLNKQNVKKSPFDNKEKPANNRPILTWNPSTGVLE